MIWGSTKLLPEKWLDALSFAQKINRFLCWNWGILRKKKKKNGKKGLHWNWDVFLPKLRCTPKKKVFNEIEMVFRHWCAQIKKLFSRIFDVLNQMGGGNRPPQPPPPRLLRLCCYLLQYVKQAVSNWLRTVDDYYQARGKKFSLNKHHVVVVSIYFTSQINLQYSVVTLRKKTIFSCSYQTVITIKLTKKCRIFPSGYISAWDS